MWRFLILSSIAILLSAPALAQIQFKHNLPTKGQLQDKGDGQIPGDLQLPDSLQLLPLGQIKNLDSLKLSDKADKEAIKKGVLDKTKESGLEQLNQIEQVQQASEIKDKVELHTGDLKEFGEFKDLKELPQNTKQKAEDIKQAKKEEIQQLPETLEQQATNIEEVQELQNQVDPLEGEKLRAEEFKNQADQYRDKEQLKQLARNRAKNVATQHFAKHADKLKAAQDKMGSLKKKYASVPNSNDLSTATKINSLEHEPFKERFFLGGTIQLLVGNPTSLDLSPLAGYRLTKKWSIGTGATYRLSFGDGNNQYTNAIDEDVYGYRAFTEYIFYKGFFAHSEFESMNKKVEDLTSDQTQRTWSNALMAGIGKEYRFAKKVKGNVMVLYNFLHSSNSPYDKPLVFRFGFILD